MESNKELKYILAGLNEALKLSETKHGALLGLNAMLIVAAVSGFKNYYNLLYIPGIVTGVFFYCLSIFSAFFSNFPGFYDVLRKRKKMYNPNLYNFKHLSILNNEDFIDEMKKIENDYTISKPDNDLISMIISTARLTHTKFKFFRFASLMTACGSGIVVITSLSKIILNF